jgi:hypothetical protein
MGLFFYLHLMLGYFENQDIMRKRKHLCNLIALAKADGELQAEELEFISKVGKHYGLNANQVNDVIKSTNSTKGATMPMSFDERLDEICELIKMIVADKNVDQSEVKVAKEMALELNFEPQIISTLIDTYQKGDMSIWEWEVFKKTVRKSYLGD